jgi:hypothetical protein
MSACALGLSLDFEQAGLWFSNTDNEHDFIMRSDDISIDPPCFFIHWPTALIVELLWCATIWLALALNDIIVWRSALLVPLDTDEK